MKRKAAIPLVADEESRPKYARFPVVSLAAEHLVMGHLLRRNILTYKAPPGNEGYDLICIHPNPSMAKRQIRVQVKSRMATDADQGFPMNAISIDAFDFLVIVRLNVGYYMKMAERHPTRKGCRIPEFYTVTPAFVKAHHDGRASWGKVYTTGLDMSAYKDDAGFETIAKRLGIEYPSKAKSV
jgi:hypothetical protein